MWHIQIEERLLAMWQEQEDIKKIYGGLRQIVKLSPYRKIQGFKPKNALSRFSVNIPRNFIEKGWARDKHFVKFTDFKEVLSLSELEMKHSIIMTNMTLCDGVYISSRVKRGGRTKEKNPRGRKKSTSIGLVS